MTSILFLIIGLSLVGGIVALVVEILSSEFEDSSDKTLYCMLILFMPLIGSLVYLFYGRKRRISEPPSEYV